MFGRKGSYNEVREHVYERLMSMEKLNGDFNSLKSLVRGCINVMKENGVSYSQDNTSALMGMYEIEKLIGDDGKNSVITNADMLFRQLKNVRDAVIKEIQLVQPDDMKEAA